MKIKCIVIDDKPLAIDLLTEYIRTIPFLELVGSSTDAIYGLELIRTESIDLVFLDIQMPQLSGIQFLKLAKGNVKVILTTAYVKYAIDGYEHDVIDYLLKPIPFPRFYQAVEKAIRSIKPAGDLLVPVTPSPENAYLFIKTEYRLQKIDIEDIIYVEGLENYVSIHTSTSRILSLQPLKKMKEQLPEKQFARVHRSFIVAMQHISFIENSNITLVNGSCVPLGKSYRADFLKMVEKR